MHTPRLLLLCVTAMTAICNAKEPRRDGSTIESAIVLPKESIDKCVGAEYAYIRSHYPGVLLNGFEHGTIVESGRWYDVFRFSTASGKKAELYFDSSRCTNSKTRDKNEPKGLTNR
jgi:hypothetical protein